MAQPLPTGAYIIRNKAVDKVLHTGVSGVPVTAADVDSHHYRDQQILWIEAIPEHKDENEDGAIYTISNIFYGVSFDAPSRRNCKIISYHSHGERWQKWIIKPAKDEKEGTFFNIINLSKLEAIEIINDNCCIFKIEENNDKQRWEFLISLVDVPAGWVQIRNVFSGDLLQQTYITSLPFLAPAPLRSNELNLRKAGEHNGHL
ncbi:hypothetical protein RUND412_004526 [Rhizina undulata]